MYMNHYHKPHRAFLRVIFGFIFAAVVSLVLMLLWNWLMPLLFGIKAVTYLQSVGLLILSKILFSGMGMRPRYDKRHEEWHRKFKSEFEKMHNEDVKE